MPRRARRAPGPGPRPRSDLPRCPAGPGRSGRRAAPRRPRPRPGTRRGPARAGALPPRIPAAHHHHVGVHDVHQAGDPLAEPPADLGEDPAGDRVAVPGCLGHHRAGHGLGMAPGQGGQVPFGVVLGGRPAEALDGPSRGDRLPAPLVAAPAQRASRLHHDVADLAGDPVGAPVQAAPGHQAAPDPGAHRDHQQVVATPARPVPVLPPRGDVGVVLDHGRKMERGAELRAQIAVAPGHVRGEQQPPGPVDQPGSPHSHRPDRAPAGQGPGEADHRGYRGVAVLGRRLLPDPVHHPGLVAQLDEKGLDLGAARVDADGQPVRSAHVGQNRRRAATAVSSRTPAGQVSIVSMAAP